ncbi:MAG: hypothetical protein L0170_17925 [Acidobacteria bacterium]|nr:hypothetical protein [Acidobacteriota bacterium]MCI0658934.1 hypothetical protein [Acidobacteriota bacterium]
MNARDCHTGPVSPGLYQIDDKTLVSIRLARSAQDPSRFRAVALAVLRDNHRVPLSSTLTAGYGADREGALQACLERVREGLERGRFPQLHRSRRPEATL